MLGHFSKIKNLPDRQSQGRSGSVGRFPSLLRHRMVRGAALEAQGKGLQVLLNLVEGTGRLLGRNRCPMCIFPQLFQLAFGFASHKIVGYKKNKLKTGMVLTCSPLIYVSCIFFLHFLSLIFNVPSEAV